ncbi:YdcF family protein [Nocardia crassostreae]|uniref:YdcF family protein n=1 Tax=Nocardia crassostreae TaxID=53428 RepID=UPI00082C6EF0|nr:YdcF family protein [Nocardia crassostreae]
MRPLLVALRLLPLLILVQFVAFLGYVLVYARRPQRPGAEVIVVLGCRLRDGRAGPLLASRLDRAVEVYGVERERGGAPVLVVSGGQGRGDSIAEADAIAAYLEAAGIPATALVRENRSRNTEENLRYTLRELRGRGIDPDTARITVVTSDFHVLRTAALARRLGLRAQVNGARTTRCFARRAVLREFAAVFAMYLATAARWGRRRESGRQLT